MSNHEENTNTTTLGIPQLEAAEPIERIALTAEEQKAINALPGDCALLIGADSSNRSARFLLDLDLEIAGRHPDADIFLDDVTVSRKHAKFTRADDGFYITDCDSLNGTYVNTDRINEVKLKNGSEVRIGKFRFVFYASPNA
ncbi:MAG: FHA domain-containing protein [Micrococcaceae bacterium]